MKKNRTRKINSVNTVLNYLVIPILLGLLIFLTVTNVYSFVIDQTKKDDNSLISNSSDNIQDNNKSVPIKQNEKTVNSCQEISDDLRQELDKISESYGSTAVQVAIIKNGVVCEYYNYGFADKVHQKPVTLKSTFRVASLSKLVDAMAVMKLSDNNIIDIDLDIGNYLGYRVRNKKFPNIIITPRMLMTHTSGIIDSQNFLKSRNSSSSIALNKLLSQSTSFSGNRPGSVYRYSNFGIAVLTAASEKVANQPFYEYTENELLNPLGIQGSFLASRINDENTVACLYDTKGNASYTVHRQLSEKCHKELGQTHHIYQGNLTISAADYAKLLCVLLNKGKDEKGNQILTPQGVSEILKVQHKSGNINCCLCNFTSESIVNGRTMHYHTGSNFGMYSSFAFDTSDRSGIVVLSSGANAKKEKSGVYNICGDIIRKIYSYSK